MRQGKSARFFNVVRKEFFQAISVTKEIRSPVMPSDSRVEPSANWTVRRRAERKNMNAAESRTRIQIEELIHSIRGERLILDSDLARIYGVQTRVLNQAVKRNLARFPADFLFQLTSRETQEILASRSQNVILKRGANVKYRPYGFTEHGAIMAANILNNAKAVQMSVFVVRAFVKIRGALNESAKMAAKLSALEQEIKGRLDTHERAIVDVLQQLMKILNPDEVVISDSDPKREIGFHVKEDDIKKTAPKKE